MTQWVIQSIRCYLCRHSIRCPYSRWISLWTLILQYQQYPCCLSQTALSWWLYSQQILFWILPKSYLPTHKKCSCCHLCSTRFFQILQVCCTRFCLALLKCSQVLIRGSVRPNKRLILPVIQKIPFRILRLWNSSATGL